MIIGIDGNEANLTQRVGVGQFAFQILTALNSLDPANTYFIYLKNPPLPDLPPASSRWRYFVVGPQFLWTKIALPFRLFTSFPRPEFFYSPGHYTPHFSPVPLIPTIHDLGYLNSASQFTRKDYYQLVNWTQHSLKRATKIVAVSEFSKSEINRIYGYPLSMITVVPNGVNPPPSHSAQDQMSTLAKFGISKPYFLTVGTLKPNKNIPRLLASYRQFLDSRPKIKPLLVIAGKKGWLFDDIFKSVIELQLEHQVIFTDFISETEKWHLYRQALASLLVSTYEGFGIPAIESQIVGTPVIASSIPALTEVLGKSALFVDHTSVDSITQALTQILNPTLAAKLSQLGQKQAGLYTWANSAARLLDLFNHAAPNKLK